MNLNEYIDHTALKATVNESDIEKLCKEAIENKFKAVCIPPSVIPLAHRICGNSDVKICTVIGFPLGYQTSSSKVQETMEALKAGADEIDMVINISKLIQGKKQEIKAEILEIAKLCHEKGAILKVILETCYLSNEQIEIGCTLSKEARADFVKTSTGFGTHGATIEHVKLMRKSVGKEVGVKASGGIKTAKDAKAMIEAGANRIGTSSGVMIIKKEVF